MIFTRTQGTSATTTSSLAVSFEQRQMKAVLVKDGSGPIENLYIGEADRPTPTLDGQVLVKVKFFGLNRMDIFQREGKYPLPPGTTSILGVEFSGTVAELGPGVADLKEGDEIFGLTYGGAYAEYVLVLARMLLPKPKHISWAEAASIPEAWLTAFQALFLVADLKEGENVLIHAGASGVGIAANQLAKHHKANHVITTAGSQEKLDFLKSMKYHPTDTINYKTEDFSERVKGITNGRGVDVVIDFIGQDYWEKNINSLAIDGRMVLLAVLSGGKFPESSSIAQILYKRLQIKGSTLRSRTPEYQFELTERFNKEFMGAMVGQEHEGPGLKTYIHKVYPWTQIQDAHREMEENKNSGKIIVEIV